MALRFFLLAITFFFASCSVPERDNPLDPDGVNYIGLFYSSSSVVLSSSSSIAPSSSSIAQSSSSVASSSSAAPSSSSIAQSSSSVVSSSSVAPSSSSLAQSSSSVVSSSSAVPSSSSVMSSSSFKSSVIFGSSVDYEGETYLTVVIGEQIWLQRNLNYDVKGSVCYDNDPANCAIYGRLYDWATAMLLPSSCNYNSCSDQIDPKHKGICPDGWHIPSNADWNTLMKHINPSCLDNSRCADAGTKLKATSGWDDDNQIIRGEDFYGFSALPGGSSYYGGFSFGSEHGYWWSASDSSSSYAYSRSMEYYNWSVGYDSRYKHYLISVRCLKD